MARRYERLTDEVCGKRACRAFFGCGNGGRDFDEFDPTEAYHALTEEERRDLCFGVVLPEDSVTEKPARRTLSPEQKKAKKERYKKNRAAKKLRWRKENQAKW